MQEAEGGVIPFPDRVSRPADFSAFFAEEHRKVFKALYFVTGNRADAAELMQDAFLKLWERWDTIDRIDDPTAYLFRVALNGSRMRARAARRATRRMVAPTSSHDPFDEIDIREDVRQHAARTGAAPARRPRPARPVRLRLGGGRADHGHPPLDRASARHPRPGRTPNRETPEARMAELTQVFEMVTKQIEPDLDAWRELEKRRRRSARNRKLGALAVAAVIVAAIALFAAKALNRGKEGSAPATEAPSRSGLAFTVVGLDGSIRGFLPWRPEGTVHPDVSPDGTMVAFAIEHGSGTQIATMRLDGTGLRIITSDSISADRPRWSPDGTRLLFYRRTDLAHLRLMVMDADGTNVREIRGTKNPEDVPPDWSPDGSLILYTSLTLGLRDLATVPATGGRSRLLTHTPLVDEGPGTWSPDGSSIAYTRRNNIRSEVWLMNADGSGAHRLVSLPDRDAAAPEWSPDGSTIAFIGYVSLGAVLTGPDAYTDAVYVVDVATGDVTEVLRPIADFEQYDSRATWLLDGDALLVLTETP